MKRHNITKKDLEEEIHFNFGIPNPLSETGYDQTPDMTAKELEKFFDSKILNLVGGCCGTTPEHIQVLTASDVRG